MVGDLSLGGNLSFVGDLGFGCVVQLYKSEL
jgi:hypothetical protein